MVRGCVLLGKERIMPKYVNDGIGLIEALDVEIEQLVEVTCLNCGEQIPTCKEERQDPKGHDIRCSKCSERWLPLH